MTRKEKFEKLAEFKIDDKVMEYLKSSFDNLLIEILADKENTMFNLMRMHKFEGWCWQTTETAILFLNDDDYIERGTINFSDLTPVYEHSWICLNFEDEEYVFDPCFNLICKKEIYELFFSPQIGGNVTARMVKDDLMRQYYEYINKTKTEKELRYHKLFCSVLGNSYSEYEKNHQGEFKIHGKEDLNCPFYRNGAGYMVEYEDNKIKKMKVHYYYNDG